MKKNSSLDAAHVEWFRWGSTVFAALCVCHPLRMFAVFRVFYFLQCPLSPVLPIQLETTTSFLTKFSTLSQVLPAQLNQLCFFSLFLWSWLRDRLILNVTSFQMEVDLYTPSSSTLMSVSKIAVIKTPGGLDTLILFKLDDDYYLYFSYNYYSYHLTSALFLFLYLSNGKCLCIYCIYAINLLIVPKIKDQRFIDFSVPMCTLLLQTNINNASYIIELYFDKYMNT